MAAEDPTPLTTIQLHREITALRELQGTRFDAMDKAVALLQVHADRQPSNDVLHERIHALSDLSVERFLHVRQQFIDRDKNIDRALLAQQDGTNAVALATATAIAKIEANFTKLIEQGQLLSANGFKNVDDKLNDMKSRLDRGEGKTSIVDPATAEALRTLNNNILSLTTSRDSNAGGIIARQSQTALIISVVLIVISLVGMTFTAVTHFTPQATAGNNNK